MVGSLEGYGAAEASGVVTDSREPVFGVDDMRRCRLAVDDRPPVISGVPHGDCEDHQQDERDDERGSRAEEVAPGGAARAARVVQHFFKNGHGVSLVV